MEKDYTIAIDAMGGDNAPKEIIKGAIKSLEIYDNIKIILLGTESKITEELKKYDYDKSKINIINTTEIIENKDNPSKAVREKKDSSIMVGIKLLKEEKADALISAGSTGALLAGSVIKLSRIKNIERPALGTFIPCEKGFTFLIDCGANVDSKPNYLLQFAIMASIYVENVLEIKNPTVGLVNIGTEEEKGNSLVKEAYNLLKSSDLNFIGNIEARDISKGKVDIVVCDGFVGNVILKTFEGLSKSILNIIKKELLSTTLSKIGALLLKKSFKNIKNRFDYKDVGGALFIGLKDLVVKAHGSSKYEDILGAIKQTHKFLDSNTIKKITEKLE